MWEGVQAWISAVLRVVGSTWIPRDEAKVFRCYITRCTNVHPLDSVSGRELYGKERNLRLRNPEKFSSGKSLRDKASLAARIAVYYSWCEFGIANISLRLPRSRTLEGSTCW